MAYATTGLKTPRGLDDAPQPSKTQSFKTQSSKKREHSPERNVPTIKPGEHLSDFAARVDREISVGRARKGTGGKGVLGGEGARKTRLEKRMQRMQRLWREEDGRLRERREEARDEDDDELDIAGGKKKMKKGKRKRKGGNVGGRGDGEDGEGDEDDDEEEDPWAVVARNRKREMEEREKTSGGGGLVGLHDVVKAPPKFSTVPKRKLNLKVDGGDMDVVGEMVKKGGLKRQVELSEARRGVIEGYRAMMREKAQAHHPS